MDQKLAKRKKNLLFSGSVFCVFAVFSMSIIVGAHLGYFQSEKGEIFVSWVLFMSGLTLIASLSTFVLVYFEQTLDEFAQELERRQRERK